MLFMLYIFSMLFFEMIILKGILRLIYFSLAVKYLKLQKSKKNIKAEYKISKNDF